MSVGDRDAELGVPIHAHRIHEVELEVCGPVPVPEDVLGSVLALFVLVGGMQGTVPIGVAPLTGEQLRLGPEFIAAYITKDWAIAAFPSHQWNVAGGEPSLATP